MQQLFEYEVARPEVLPTPTVRPEGWRPEVLPDSGEKLQPVVNEERVEQVLGLLMDSLAKEGFPYNQDKTRLPQDPRHMPESLPRGGSEHAMFFWNACYYMRGGIKSIDAIIRLSRLYASRPDIFDCNVAQSMDPAEIAILLREHGLGFQGVVSKQWVENAKRMQERYDGDPRKIFENTTDYDTCLARVMNDGKGGGFKGFREKMTSMIMYYLMDEKLIPEFNFPLPVDLHVLRVSIANGLIEFPNVPYGTNLYKEEVLACLRKLYFDYAERHNISQLRLCDAVWMLSESTCERNPGNVTFEPLGRKNRDGRNTYLVPQTIDIANTRQQADYANSCALCPLEDTCDYDVPGGTYYIAGALIMRRLRTRFPGPAFVQDTLAIPE